MYARPHVSKPQTRIGSERRQTLKDLFTKPHEHSYSDLRPVCDRCREVSGQYCLLQAGGTDLPLVALGCKQQ